MASFVVARRTGQRCAMCHDALAGPHATCQGCRTTLHLACARELRGCPTLGCGGIWERKALRSPRALGWLAPLLALLAVIPGVVAGSLLLAVLASLLGLGHGHGPEVQKGAAWLCLGVAAGTWTVAGAGLVSWRAGWRGLAWGALSCTFVGVGLQLLVTALGRWWAGPLLFGGGEVDRACAYWRDWLALPLTTALSCGILAASAWWQATRLEGLAQRLWRAAAGLGAWGGAVSASMALFALGLSS